MKTDLCVKHTEHKDYSNDGRIVFHPTKISIATFPFQRPRRQTQDEEFRFEVYEYYIENKPDMRW